MNINSNLFTQKNVFSYEKQNDFVIVNLQTGKLKIQICADNIIRVLFTHIDSFPKDKSLIVLKQSYEGVKWNIQEGKDELNIITDQIKARLDKNSGLITFFDKNGKIILSEAEKPRIMDPVKVLDENTFSVTQKFILSKDEGLYGLGQYQDGIMNYRGKDILLVQANTVAVNPFLVSSNGYGILWDNCSKTKLHDGEDGMYFWSEVADVIDYYFIYGKNIDEVIAGYRYLTGKAPLFGKWVYGYWQSKERYKNRNELVSVAKEYRDRKIPIDNIIQDWRYWGENPNWSSMKWDENVFPNAKEMIDLLHNKYNVHLMVSVWPALGVETEIYKELNKKGLLLKNDDHWTKGKVYDAFSKEAREIYWKYMNKGLFSTGVDAWWMDATEPEFESADTQEITEKGIKKCGKTSLGNFARYLNAYSLMSATGVYQGQRSQSNDKRVFILTRSVFAGQQRNAAATWSGDIGASWKILREQISAGLNFCLAGVPYWSSDIGGFFPDSRGGNYPLGVKDTAYHELYVRWFQFGAFGPIFRSHGTGTPREVWQFGEPGDWAYDALVKADILRYRLIPYIYSLAWKVTNEGYTMMRGLIMDFPDDKKVFNLNNQFMFGSSILVIPVTQEMYHKIRSSGSIIPSKNLFTKDGEVGGLTGEYFKGTNFNESIGVRKDGLIDFIWLDNYPKGLTDTNFSVRWEGKILTGLAGEYEFTLRSDDGVRLWIDNKLIIDQWNEHPSRIDFGSIKLEASKKYDLKLEYYQALGSAVINLMWDPPQKIKIEESINNTVNIYLPRSNGWYDFWTGKFFNGGEKVEREVPIDIIPLYIKAGSIIPFGPEVEYTTERPANPIELRIYSGADAEFVIYEDENDNYNYEKGIYSLIPITWDEKTQILTIGERKGVFPGMLKERTFNIVWVKENHGVGEKVSKPDVVVQYSGKTVSVKK